MIECILLLHLQYYPCPFSSLVESRTYVTMAPLDSCVERATPCTNIERSGRPVSEANFSCRRHLLCLLAASEVSCVVYNASPSVS